MQVNKCVCVRVFAVVSVPVFRWAQVCVGVTPFLVSPGCPFRDRQLRNQLVGLSSIIVKTPFHAGRWLVVLFFAVALGLGRRISRV